MLPAADGLEYVTTIEDYRLLPGLGADLDAIVIKNMRDGRVEDIFELSNSVVGSARLSPDRQVVAAIWRDESSGEGFGEDRLTLFARDGTVLSRSPHQNISSFDWASDGRLVYSVGDSIYITMAVNNVTEQYPALSIRSING